MILFADAFNARRQLAMWKRRMRKAEDGAARARAELKYLEDQMKSKIKKQRAKPTATVAASEETKKSEQRAKPTATVSSPQQLQDLPSTSTWDPSVHMHIDKHNLTDSSDTETEPNTVQTVTQDASLVMLRKDLELSSDSSEEEDF